MSDLRADDQTQPPGVSIEHDSLRPDDLMAIDEVCDQFEAAWRTEDNEPDLDTFLHKVKPELRSVALEELLAVDCHWRHQRDHSDTHLQDVAPESRAGIQISPDTVYARLRNQFILEQRVGSGATGEVWKATNRQTGEIVAVKIPHLGLLGSLTALIRFCREARWQTRLRHPRIGAPEEVVMAGEMPVLVSRFVDGVTLKDYLRRQNLTIDQAVELVIQLADGLEYAHAMGIVHRDLKPANVLLERLTDGQIDPSRPVIVDFGLAIATDQTTVTHDGQTLGTPAYMSPEQARGGSHAAGIPSDIYSLGVILFESLTGQLPIDGNDVPTLLHNVIYDSPRPLRSIRKNLPVDLDQVCAACLRKSPRERYQSARDLAEDLRRWRRHETIRMRRPNAFARISQWGKRHPAILTSTVSLWIAIAATTLLIMRESYLERLQSAYDKSTRAIYSARSAHEKLEAHLAAYRMGRIGAYWSLNNPEQARLLLEQCSSVQRTWEWRYFNRLVNRYQRELRHSSDSDEGKFSVRSLAVTSDSGTLFSGSRGGTIYRWNLLAGKPKPELFDSFSDAVMAIACSPDDQWICYGTNEGSFVLRRLDGDAPVIHSFHMLELAIHAVAFSPDGKLVAIGGGKQLCESFTIEEGFLIVIDVATGKEVFRDSSFDRCIVSLDWHPNGEKLLGAGAVASMHPDSLRSRGAIWLWNTKTWHHQAFITPRIARGIDWSPIDPNLFAVSFGDGNRAFWSASEAKETQRLPPLLSGAKMCQFSPDGQVLATASDDGTCSLWNVSTATSSVTYHAHSEGIQSLAFTANNQLLTGGSDEFIRFWDATPIVDRTLEIARLGKFASSTQSGNTILVAANDTAAATGRIYAIPITRDIPDTSPNLLYEFPATIVAIASAPSKDRQLCAILDDGTINYLRINDEDLESAQPIANRQKPIWKILPFAVSDEFVLSRLRMVQLPGKTFISVPDLSTIASSNKDNQNRIWSLDENQTHFNSVTETNFGAGRAFAVAPNAKWMATVSDELFVSLWSGTPFKPVHKLYGHERVISALAFNGNGTRLATGSWDRRILIWNVEDQTKTHVLTGHTGNVLAIAFHPTEALVFSSGTDRVIRVWDLATGIETATLTGHKAPVTNLYFDSKGDTLVSVDDNGQVRCW